MPSWLESRNSSLHFWNISWKIVNPGNIFTNGDWIFSQSRTMSSRKCDLMAIVMVKLKHRKEHFIAHNARKRCIKKGLQGILDRFQKDWRFRDSQLKVGRTEAKCRRDLPVGAERFHLSPITWGVLRDIRNPCLSLWTHLAEMHRWNSDQISAKHWQNWTVFTVNQEKSDSHRFPSWTISEMAFVVFFIPAHHGCSGMTTDGAHKFIKFKYLWSSWYERHHRPRRLVGSGFLTKLFRVTLWRTNCSEIVYSC